jgi:hypothetical protein
MPPIINNKVIVFMFYPLQTSNSKSNFASSLTQHWRSPKPDVSTEKATVPCAMIVPVFAKKTYLIATKI